MRNMLKTWVVPLVVVGPIVVCLVQSRMRNNRPIENPVRPSMSADLDLKPISSSDDATEASIEHAKVVLRGCIVEFSVASPEADVLLTDFQSRLDLVLEDFNSQSATNPQSATSSSDFVSSDAFARLIDNFKSKGDVVIHQEAPKVVPDGQTEQWGERAATVSDAEYRTP